MTTNPQRTALVTGAARGIGAATVRKLVAAGYAVVAVDCCLGDGPGRPAGIDYPLATRAELEALAATAPGCITPIVADVRRRDDLEQAAAAAVSASGRLDVVVAAAGVIAGGTPLWNAPQEQFQSMWDVNVRGVWNAAAAGIPRLLAGPEPAAARFVAVASAAATHGLFHLAAYNAAKHAVVGLVKGLAVDLVGTGVTAVAVSPGSTRTAMLRATANLYGLADENEFAVNPLVRRLIEPDEIAATIVFCCSREGAVLDGSVVSADGGFRP